MLRITLILLVVLSTTTATVCAQTRQRAWLAGTWEGTGFQIDSNETWTMKLTVRGSRYRIEYPSLKCSGHWVPISLGSRAAIFRERITTGLEECVDRGRVVVERLGRRQLAYRFSYRGEHEITASAILNRKK